MPAITPWSLVVHGQRTQSDGRKRRVRSEEVEQSSGSLLNIASRDSADRGASSGSPSILCSCYNPCARTSPCVAHRRRQSSLHDGVSILWSSCAVARIGLPHANGEGSSRRCDLELVRARGTANVRAQAKPNQFPRYHPRPFLIRAKTERFVCHRIGFPSRPPGRTGTESQPAGRSEDPLPPSVRKASRIPGSRVGA